jgi:Flp pilus assembly protein TadG
MKRRRGQAGYVAVSTALTIVLLLGFAALAVDVGLLLGARSAAQRAADAAALAGAFTFVADPQSPQPATAQNHALATALVNGVLENPITAPEVTVNVDVGNRRVTVDIVHPRGTFFARAFGSTQATIGVRGVAEASPTSTGSACTKPWFIPNTVMSAQAPCDACAAGEVFVSGGTVTPFAQALTGFQFTIKPSNPQNALAPGQFYAIRMPDSQGGNDYRTNIATCSPDFVYCNETYGVEPGNMIGPTIQGVRDFAGDPPNDSFLAVSQYHNNSSGIISDTSPQLAISPIWDICGMPGFCPGNQLPGGGATIQIGVIGYALIFIEGVQGNDVISRLIWASSCAAGGGGGGGGAGPAPPETGPYSIPVRLVRLP